jgi:excisionase family DNA binding protein
MLCFLRLVRRIQLMETMLKTGDAAQLLGVSRQHVVNMCDRGDIACVFVGRHRRISTSEVERLSARPTTREEEKSLWLHRALLTPLMTETEAAMSKARENLGRWTTMHRRDGMTMAYLKEWERVLDEGLEAVMWVMTSPSQEARDMRQNSPFAGVLSDQTRTRVLQSFQRHWATAHDPIRA